MAGLALAAASPAAGAWSRRGSLNWKFDDITVKNEQGRLRRSQWYQGYDLNILGPIGLPALGDFDASGRYSDGADINTAVNYQSPRQKTIGGRVSADLFGPWVRRYFRFSPNYSYEVLRRPEGDAGELHNSGWGFGTGLSLPRLPALSFSRQSSRIEDRSSSNPTRQETTVQREGASYSLGRLMMSFDHELQTVSDLMGEGRENRTEQSRASVRTDLYELKRVPLQAFSWRFDFQRFDSNGMRSTDQLTDNVSLRTLAVNHGSWKSALTYWNNLQRDMILAKSRLNHSAAVDSTRALRRGSLTNSLTVGHTAGDDSTISVNDGLTTGLTFASGTVTSNSGVSAGWTRSSMGQASVHESLNTGLAYSPRRAWSAFVEAQAQGSHGLEGADAETRTWRLGSGSTFGLPLNGKATARFDRTYAKDYQAGTRSVNDQVAVQAGAVPVERLHLNGSVNLGYVSSDPGGRTETIGMTGSVSYLFLFGLSLTGEVNYSGSTYDSSASAQYAIGKTLFTVRYEHRELSTRDTYGHLSVGLTRSF